MAVLYLELFETAILYETMTIRDVALRILWDICYCWPEISEGILLYLPSFIYGNGIMHLW